jgi:uncharacterized protein YbjQ (UPF0145 family)
MKALRIFGSLAFVLGLFFAIFAGIPWYVVAADDPAAPWWLKISIFSFLGGILIVLLTVVTEQRKSPIPVSSTTPTKPESSILLLNSAKLPDRDITKILGLVQGHTVFAIWIGKDLSALIRLVVGGELTEYTDMMGRARELATRRMMAKAAEIGADAVINTRYMTTSVVGSAAELLVYGTAVKLSS